MTRSLVSGDGDKVDLYIPLCSQNLAAEVGLGLHVILQVKHCSQKFSTLVSRTDVGNFLHGVFRGGTLLHVNVKPVCTYQIYFAEWRRDTEESRLQLKTTSQVERRNGRRHGASSYSKRPHKKHEDHPRNELKTGSMMYRTAWLGSAGTWTALPAHSGLGHLFRGRTWIGTLRAGHW